MIVHVLSFNYMPLAFHPQLKVYHAVIEDVITNVRDAFLDEGVDEQVLQEMKQIWRNKLLASKAVELSPDEGTHPPPIVANNPKVGLIPTTHSTVAMNVNFSSSKSYIYYHIFKCLTLFKNILTKTCCFIFLMPTNNNNVTALHHRHWLMRCLLHIRTAPHTHTNHKNSPITHIPNSHMPRLQNNKVMPSVHLGFVRILVLIV